MRTLSGPVAAHVWASSATCAAIAAATASSAVANAAWIPSPVVFTR